MAFPRDCVYLDHAATTPVDPRVIDVMTEVLRRDFGNPSSSHEPGQLAERLLQQARLTLARKTGVDPEQVIFTSGGTEALALGILGTAALRSKPGHVLVSAIEHAATLNTCASLEALGHHVEKVPPRPGHRAKGGVIDVDDVAARLREDTFLVAVMHVNNETGIEQPIAEIGKLIAEREHCRFLVDAVQSFAKLPTSLTDLNVDLMAISAHKIHGPKGVGALIRRRDLTLAPLWGGGAQESGLRPGTENVAAIAGFARATELEQGDANKLRVHVDRLIDAIQGAHPLAFPVGDPALRVPHMAAVAMPRVRTGRLVEALSAEGVYVSTGSACHSHLKTRSEVSRAMGLGHGIVRLAVAGTTTVAEIDLAIEKIRATLDKQRTSP